MKLLFLLFEFFAEDEIPSPYGESESNFRHFLRDVGSSFQFIV